MEGVVPPDGLHEFEAEDESEIMNLNQDGCDGWTGDNDVPNSKHTKKVKPNDQ